MLGYYTAKLSCTNAMAGSPTTLPNTVGGSVTPRNGDDIRCTITNTPNPPSVALLVTKTTTATADPYNSASNPKRIPGGTSAYDITVVNTGFQHNDMRDTGPDAAKSSIQSMLDKFLDDSDKSGELKPQYRPAPLVASFMQEPGVAQRSATSGDTLRSLSDDIVDLHLLAMRLPGQAASYRSLLRRLLVGRTPRPEHILTDAELASFTVPLLFVADTALPPPN